MQQRIEGYLDIETTGLSPYGSEITVVGIYRYNGELAQFIQLVGEDISARSITQALNGVKVLYTYNGSRFDLPFIRSRLGVNLAEEFEHHDLMYDCWKCNLYGGFKAVERHLGIKRKRTEIDGLEAIRLWWEYINNQNKKALAILLEYNKEDVINLKVLRDRLP